MDQRPHIVVVEDEATQRQLLCDYLDKQNFRVSPADGGSALRRLLERELPALVLLDVGLPGEDGFALARWLREKSGRIGIIMVTTASDTVDRVVGLETGADDYIGKPYEPRELLARIKSVLRRSTGAPAASGPRVRMGRRVLDLEKRVLADPSDGSEETLTASEFDLLKLFAKTPTGRCNATGCWNPLRIARWRHSTGPLTCASRGFAARSRLIRPIQTPFAPCVGSAICSFRPRTKGSPRH